MFFVLSGYLITTVLIFEIHATENINLKSFYIRRCLRLMPAFGALLSVMLLESVVSHNAIEKLESIAISAVYLMNWNRAFAWLPQGALGHTWSLAMEEQFYLVWPVFLICLFKRRHRERILVCAIIAVVCWRIFLVSRGADPERTYNGFDTHSDGLLIGCLLAFLISANALPKVFRVAGRFAIVPALTILISIFAVRLYWPFTQGVGLTLSAVMSAWIISATATNEKLRAFLSLRPLVYTGKISYGWYLWHYPILTVFSAKIFHHGLMVLVICGYVAAALSYEYIERPVLRFKRKYGSVRRADETIIRPGTFSSAIPGRVAPAPHV